MMNRIFVCAIVQFCIIGYAFGQVAQITRLNVQCDRSGMKVNVEFDNPFNGIVFSKGHYSDPNCRHVKETSSRTSYEFYISSTRCGTIGTDMRGSAAQGFKNVIIVQNDPDFQDVMDSARKLSCDWVTKLEKYVTFAPFGVDMLGVKELRFPGDTVDCWMDIQRGHGPFAPAVGGVVPIGEKLTVVIYVRDNDNSFDVHVKDCYAYDSPEYRNPNSRALQLTNEQGCPVKEKLVQGFFRTKDVRNSGATVIAYGIINAFKFPEKMDVFLACNVEVCKGSCPSNDCQPEVTVAGSDEPDVTTPSSASSTEASTSSGDEEKEEATSEAPEKDDDEDEDETKTDDAATPTEESESSEDTSEAPKEEEETKEEGADEEEKSEEEEKPAEEATEEKTDSSAEETEEKTDEKTEDSEEKTEESTETKTEDASEEAEQTKDSTDEEEPAAVSEAPKESKADDDEDEEEKKAAKLKLSITKKNSKKSKIVSSKPKTAAKKSPSKKTQKVSTSVKAKKSAPVTASKSSKKPKSSALTKAKKGRSPKTSSQSSKSGKLKASASMKQSRSDTAKKPRRIARAPSSIPEAYTRRLLQVNSWNSEPSMYQFNGRHIRSRRSITLNNRENATFPAMMHSISIISPIEDLDEKELDAWEKMTELEGKAEEISLTETLKRHGIAGYCFSLGGLVSASVLFAAVVMILSMSVHMVFAHLQSRHSNLNAKVVSLY